jgi:hypothetical protein
LIKIYAQKYAFFMNDSKNSAIIQQFSEKNFVAKKKVDEKEFFKEEPVFYMYICRIKAVLYEDISRRLHGS